MLTALQRSGGIEALARQAQVEPLQALAEVKEILPWLTAALREFADGRQALLALFEQEGGVGLASQIMSVEPADPAPGRAIAARVLGAERSGSAILPLLVMLVGGYVSALAAGHGLGTKGIDTLLGEGQ